MPNNRHPRTTVLVPLDDTPRDAAIRAALAYSREHTDMRVRLRYDHCMIGEAVNGVWYPTSAHHHPSCPARLGDGACICPSPARDLDMSDVHADAAMDPSLDRPCDTPDCDGTCPLVHEDGPMPPEHCHGVIVPEYATDREETEPCERGTVGCCVKHGTDDTGCEAW